MRRGYHFNRYQGKISGPLLDRIDIVSEVARIDQADIIKGRRGESSATIAWRVQTARLIQQDRNYDLGGTYNAHMITSAIQKYCKNNSETASLAASAMSSLDLSARTCSRILKVARTIADLDGFKTILTHHFTESLQYRPGAAGAKAKF
ncbi:MAG: hypothetical protein NVSMB39_7370 [Candidatus Saccharimonadales bacterium]